MNERFGSDFPVPPYTEPEAYPEGNPGNLPGPNEGAEATEATETTE
jgi:hypothetical protein